MVNGLVLFQVEENIGICPDICDGFARIGGCVRVDIANEPEVGSQTRIERTNICITGYAARSTGYCGSKIEGEWGGCRQCALPRNQIKSYTHRKSYPCRHGGRHGRRERRGRIITVRDRALHSTDCEVGVLLRRREIVPRIGQLNAGQAHRGNVLVCSGKPNRAEPSIRNTWIIAEPSVYIDNAGNGFSGVDGSVDSSVLESSNGAHNRSAHPVLFLCLKPIKTAGKNAGVSISIIQEMSLNQMLGGAPESTIGTTLGTVSTGGGGGSGAAGPSGPSGPTGPAGPTPSNLNASNVTTSNLALTASSAGTYYYISTTAFNALSMPGTLPTTAGVFWTLRNATGSYLSATVANGFNSTPPSPLVLAPYNNTTIAVSVSGTNGMTVSGYILF